MRPLRFLPILLLPFLPGSPVSGPTTYGVVRDDDGPLSGATVRFQGLPGAVQTDGQGRFRLPMRAGRIVASKPGYLIAGAAISRSPIVFHLKKLPDADCETYAWVDPNPDPLGRHNCGNCHQEIHDEWSTGGHARSATNPRLLNLIDGTDAKGKQNVGWSLSADNPDGVTVCNSCHAPTAGPFDDLRKLTGVAAQGVHCDYCHKVADVEPGKIGWAHGRYGLKLLRPAKDQLFFGPLDDVDRGEDSFTPLYRDSRYCASCHEGTVLGVHVYGTYAEWQQSPARREGKQCQSCHMAPTGRMTNLAPGKGGIPRDPHTLAGHRFFPGGQADMLRNCLKLSTVLKPTADGLRVEVEIRAEGVGHRVPTGFVDRNLVLIVEGQRGTETIPARSGPLLPPAAGKDFAGRPGRLYAKLLKGFDGQGPVPFWRADPSATDTRLVPGQPERTTFDFGPEADQVRVRLLYRRFWPETARVKGWPDDAILVIDKHTQSRKAAKK